MAKARNFKTSSFRFLKFAGPLLAVLILFQNCGRFEAPTVGSNSDSSFLTLNAAGAKTVRVPAQELVPLELRLPERWTLPSQADLPSGAVLDESTRTLYFIPARGQAGVQVVPIASTDGDVSLLIDIKPTSDEVLRKGPFDFYKDGDVGYVFVHGAGEADRCRDRADLAKYWGGTIDIIAPDPSQRTVACYDGRHAVADVTPSVADQILSAKCGRYGKCIVVTHSMGGLVLEHLLTHARDAKPGDPEPALFGKSDLYKKAKGKVLFVVSLASAAGGSKVADIVEKPQRFGIGQALVAYLSTIVGRNQNGATRSLKVDYASKVLAPLNQDPGVPVFMVPGYSVKITSDAGGLLSGIFEIISRGKASDLLFNRNNTLALLDRTAIFKSRSDGLVDFRSACGVASANGDDGPGYSAALSMHFEYCASAPKKPNHFVWFAQNLNHYLMSLPALGECGSRRNPCETRVPADDGKTLVPVAGLKGLSAVQVIRKRLTENTMSAIQKPIIIK